ncbi:MAG: hypothetical protein WDM85_14925 [Caulobacteraceae bacterium]
MWTVTANCLCYGALAFAPNIWAAVAIRVVGGMCAGNGSVVQGYIADVTPVELRAGRMARLGAAYNLGFILGAVRRRHAGQALDGHRRLSPAAAALLGALRLFGDRDRAGGAGKPGCGASMSASSPTVGRCWASRSGIPWWRG